MIDIPPGTPLICRRVSEIPKPPVHSFRGVQCVLCGAEVWVAYSSPLSETIWCWPCAIPRLEDDEDVELAITGSQIIDIEAFLRKP
jgi:hypothetical protein